MKNLKNRCEALKTAEEDEQEGDSNDVDRKPTRDKVNESKNAEEVLEKTHEVEDMAMEDTERETQSVMKDEIVGDYSTDSNEEHGDNSDGAFDIDELNDEERECADMLKSAVEDDSDGGESHESENDQVLILIALLDDAEEKLQMKEEREKSLEQQNKELRAQLQDMRNDSAEVMNAHIAKVAKLENALKTSEEALKAKSKQLIDHLKRD